ncbi:hypothetical protein Hanom_Chr03g00248981 [Helianthus anomalus]
MVQRMRDLLLRFYLANLISKMKLFHDNTESTCGNIVTRVHARVRRGDNRHKMSSVTGPFAWVPYVKSEIILFNWAKHDGVGPTPMCIYSEKTRNQHTR